MLNTKLWRNRYFQVLILLSLILHAIIYFFFFNVSFQNKNTLDIKIDSKEKQKREQIIEFFTDLPENIILKNKLKNFNNINNKEKNIIKNKDIENSIENKNIKKESNLPAQLRAKKSNFGWVLLDKNNNKNNISNKEEIIQIPDTVSPEESTEESSLPVGISTFSQATELIPELAPEDAQELTQENTQESSQEIIKFSQELTHEPTQELTQELAPELTQEKKETKLEHTQEVSQEITQKLEQEKTQEITQEKKPEPIITKVKFKKKEKKLSKTERQLKKELKSQTGVSLESLMDEIISDEIVYNKEKNNKKESNKIINNIFTQDTQDTNIKARIEKIARRQEQLTQFSSTNNVGLKPAKVSTARVRGARAVCKKGARGIIALTRGYVENLNNGKDEGEDLIDRDGDPNKRPTFEEMKYISYEAEINWCLQASWKQNFAYNRTHSIQEGKAVIEFTIDEKGKIIAAELLQSSGHSDLDRIIMKNLKFAGPFPPLPKHFGTKSYTTGRIIHVFCNKFGI